MNLIKMTHKKFSETLICQHLILSPLLQESVEVQTQGVGRTCRGYQWIYYLVHKTCKNLTECTTCYCVPESLS